MAIKILKRHKSSEGRTIDYTVNINGTVLCLDASSVRKNASQVTNAKLLSNGEFKANSGCTIETVLNVEDLKPLPLSNRNSIQRVESPNLDLPEDYYGKGFVSVCRIIRKKASKGELKVEQRVHQSNQGRNVDLFKMIEACGISVETFVKGYLSVLQPYALQQFMSKKHDSGSTWLCDVGYRYYLVIKIVDLKSDCPMVVSFHESNRKGLGNSSKVVYQPNKLCAVLINKKEEGGGGYRVDYLVQRGFIRSNLHSTVDYCNKDLAFVKYSDISNEINSIMDRLFSKLQEMYYDGDKNENDLPSFSIETDKVSFMSCGFATINNMSLLIDLYSKYSGNKPSLLVLSGIATNLIAETPKGRLTEIREALRVKYKGVYSKGKNRLYDAIMED